MSNPHNSSSDGYRERKKKERKKDQPYLVQECEADQGTGRWVIGWTTDETIVIIIVASIVQGGSATDL